MIKINKNKNITWIKEKISVSKTMTILIVTY
jgi:hypothetical protein